MTTGASTGGGAPAPARASREPCIALVTIHGIGFEQRPTPGAPMSGYADMLHARLSRALNSGDGPPLFSDDPTTQRPLKDGAPAGDAGPVYVESAWPVDSYNREAGLRRLGVWRGKHTQYVMGAIEGLDEAPLVQQGAPIGHVALVYSHLEDEQGSLDNVVETAVKAAAAFGNYQNTVGAIHMALTDIMAAIHQRPPRPAHGSQVVTTGGPSSLRVRRDAPYRLPRFGWRPLPSSPIRPVPRWPMSCSSSRMMWRRMFAATTCASACAASCVTPCCG